MTESGIGCQDLLSILSRADMALPIYQPLPYPRSIRVIAMEKVESGDEWETPIVCDPAVIDSNDTNRIPYAAVSYTWGDPIWRPEGSHDEDSRLYQDSSHSIECNGQILGVKKNLFDASDCFVVRLFSVHFGRCETSWDSVCQCGQTSCNVP